MDTVETNVLQQRDDFNKDPEDKISDMRQKTMLSCTRAHTYMMTRLQEKMIQKDTDTVLVVVGCCTETNKESRDV